MDLDTDSEVSSDSLREKCVVRLLSIMCHFGYDADETVINDFSIHGRAGTACRYRRADGRRQDHHRQAADEIL